MAFIPLWSLCGALCLLGGERWADLAARFPLSQPQSLSIYLRDASWGQSQRSKMNQTSWALGTISC